MQIKSRFDGRVLYECEAETMLETLQKAVKAATDLSGAYLSRANLSGAYLSGAYLSRANLSRADLSRANLSRANLSRANLSGTNLSGAYLSGADLSRANLSRANLSRAYLSGAYLSGADLSRANLSGANLSGAKLNWNSHWLIGEILKRAAGDDVEKRCLAGGIAISTDWCWKKMLSIEHSQKAWALSVLIPLIHVGDNAPKELIAIRDSMKQ